MEESPQEPFFSIVLITYNRAHLLSRSIRSVSNQKFGDWELLVVDDGSTDCTREVVAGYDDPRIRYIYQENQHISVARNTGIEHARGRYICLLDDDDWYYDTHLQELQNGIEKQGFPIGFFYTGAFDHYDSGKIEKRELPGLPIKNGVEHVLMYTVLPSTSCIHQKIYQQYKFKTEHIPAEDRALWVQITARYPIYRLPVNTVAYFRHDDQATQIISDKFKIEDVDKQLASLRKVLAIPDIKKAVSATTVQLFFSRHYYWYMFSALNRKDRAGAFRLLVKSIWENPSMLATKKTLAAMRDILLLK